MTETLLYRVYMTDAIKAVAENTAHFAGGTTLSGRWVDIIDTKPAEQDERECVEIATDIWARIRGENH